MMSGKILLDRKETSEVLQTMGVKVSPRHLRTLARVGLIPKPQWKGGRGKRAQYDERDLFVIQRVIQSINNKRPISYDTLSDSVVILGEACQVAKVELFVIENRSYKRQVLLDGRLVLTVKGGVDKE
jgi:hypothetical protein